MTRAHLALLALLVVLAPSGAAAQPAPTLRLDRLRFEVTYHGQSALRLRLERQPDGSYLADYGGEGMPTRTGVSVPASSLDELRQALAGMDGFPTDAFTPDWREERTRFVVRGELNGAPWRLARRYYAPMHDEGLLARHGALLAAAQNLVAALEVPHVSEVVYRRGIEWGGEHVMVSLVLRKQPDGSFTVDVGGEDHAARAGVPLDAVHTKALLDWTLALQQVPEGETFAGDGNHWFTEVHAAGVLPGSGAAWSMRRRFFDPAAPLFVAEKLDEAVAAAIASLPPPAPTTSPTPPTPSTGLVGGIPD